MRQNYFAIKMMVLIAVLCLPAMLHAQPGFGDDVDDVPVDGGLSLLIVAGLAHGIKRMKTVKKRS